MKRLLEHRQRNGDNTPRSGPFRMTFAIAKLFKLKTGDIFQASRDFRKGQTR